MKTLWASLLAMVLLFSTAQAATVITAGTDAELRAAVAACGTITFNFNGTITLTSPIPVNCSVEMDATGHSVVLSGGGSNRLFDVKSNATLFLIGLTVANGAVRGSNGIAAGNVNGESVTGGAVLVQGGTLQAWDCVFTNNLSRGGNGGSSGFGPLPVGGNAVGGAVHAQQSTLYLWNCRFENNSSFGGAGGFRTVGPGAVGTGSGAALYANGGDLWIQGCVFTNNNVGKGGGGAVWCQANDAIIANSRFQGNSAQTAGAISHSAGFLNVSNVIFTGNAAVGAPYERYGDGLLDGTGGAYDQVGGSATIDSCLFAFNQAQGAQTGQGSFNTWYTSSGLGGALAHRGGFLQVGNSLLASNLALGGLVTTSSSVPKGEGGAIYASANLNVINCTLAWNRAQPAPKVYINVFDYGIGIGGALSVAGGTSTVSSCTVALNLAGTNSTQNAYGGGLAQSGGTLLVLNSILSSNLVNGISTNAAGNITDLGYNLSSDHTPAWTNVGSLNNTDARLLPLANNGGLTPTMALAAGSPALNAAVLTFPYTDQRGVTRPQGPGPDVGAWEGAGGAVRLAIFRENAATNRLSWLSDTGVTYRVEGASVLNSWNTLATGLPGAGGSVQHRATNSGLRYFRVATEP